MGVGKGFSPFVGHDIISESPVDVQKQIAYWSNGSEEDLDAARDLLRQKHYRHSMFFAHLAIEKILKAHVVKKTKRMPPKIHNLARLAEIAELKLDEARTRILLEFDVYQLAGRYPDSAQAKIDVKTATREFSTAEGMVEWLRNQL